MAQLLLIISTLHVCDIVSVFALQTSDHIRDATSRRRGQRTRRARNPTNSRDSKRGLSLKNDSRYAIVTHYIANRGRKLRNRGDVKNIAPFAVNQERDVANNARVTGKWEQLSPARLTATREVAILCSPPQRGNEFFTNSMYLLSFST
jgi:hypothetical protein